MDGLDVRKLYSSTQGDYLQITYKYRGKEKTQEAFSNGTTKNALHLLINGKYKNFLWNDYGITWSCQTFIDIREYISQAIEKYYGSQRAKFIMDDVNKYILKADMVFNKNRAVLLSMLASILSDDKDSHIYEINGNGVYLVDIGNANGDYVIKPLDLENCICLARKKACPELLKILEIFLF